MSEYRKILLGDVLTEFSVRNKGNVNYPVYSVTNSQGFCRDFFSKEVASQIKTTYKIVPKGYFAYNPSRINVGSVDWQREEDKVIVSPLYVVFGVSKDLRQDYLQYYLKSRATLNRIKAFSTGTVRANLKFSALCSFEINLPSIAKQEQVVDELNCIYRIIKKKKQQLKELDNLSQSIFYDMFGDPVTNERGWETKRLKDISTSQIGVTYKPENVVTDNTGTIILRSSNIQDSALDFSDIVRVNCPIKENKYVKKDDILMCSRNGSINLVGKVAMVPNLPEKMAYGAFMTIIRSDYQPYLFAFFKSPAFRVQLTDANTSTINQITTKMLDAIKVALPPLSLQQEFASKIEAIEKQKELIKQSLSETETLFNSRMDYYFN